ncbi:MAG: tetratricopeptide repeat protein [Bacteroidales bacterium]|nr:tetratricopeptide repeat protein [Bacteroidales bacterium]
MKQFFAENKSNPWWWAFLAIATILFFAMPMMSRDAGNSGDEMKFQVPQGYNVLNYYKTDGQDSTCMTFENLKYYGCSFDVVTAWWNETFHVDDIARTRHAANAFMGWLVVLFVGLIVWRMAGWRAAVMALLLMFFSPRFLGHSFNNPKDIPFAAGVIMAMYYMMMFFRQAPKPRWSTMIMLAFSIAFALSIRVGALILIGYLGLWGILWIIFHTNENRNTLKGGKREAFMSALDWNGTFKTIGFAAAICIVGFFAGLLIWPYAWQSPIKNTVDSYHAMSQFAINIRQIYEGRYIMSNELPWYYTPKFILTTIPIAVIVGWLMYPFVGAFKKGRAMESIMVYFCCIFPVFWIVYTNANVYGGWRHSLFAYPPMVAAAALGFDGLVQLFQDKGKRVLQYIATVLPFLLLIPPALHCFRNHPYEYIYFNELAGGTKKQLGYYEMDYYYHSVRGGTEWILENCEPVAKPDGEKTIIGSFLANDVKYYIRHDTTQYRHKFLRYDDRYNQDWDYAVFNITAMDPEYLRSDNFPPKNTIHTIDVDGVPIAIVLRRDDKSDYLGLEQLRSGNVDSAFALFRKALQHDPSNEGVRLNMANVYLQRGANDSVLSILKPILDQQPHHNQAVTYAAYAYVNKGAVNEAMSLCEEMRRYSPTSDVGYSIPLNIRMQQGDLMSAETIIRQMLDNDVVNDQMIQNYIKIMMARGLDQNTATRSVLGTIAKNYEDHGRKAEAEQFRSYLR